MTQNLTTDPSAKFVHPSLKDLKEEGLMTSDSLTNLLITKDPRLLDQMEIVYKDQALWKQEQLRKEKLVAGKFQKVLTETELEELREIFRLVDIDDSGEISAEELGVMLQTIGLPATEDDIQKMMVEVDTDQSGGKFDSYFRDFVLALFVWSF